MSKASLIKGFNDFVEKHYGGDTGKMLIHTGVIGWLLSSAAQVVAIVINDKIPKEQKMFLIPQEIADAGVNIASFYLITQSFKSVAEKLVKTGKWLPASVRTFLKDNNLAEKAGKANFDVLKDANLTKELSDKYKSFSDGVDVVATTVGSILSCNIVTPIIRNEIASRRQKTGIAKMNNVSNQPLVVKTPNVSGIQKDLSMNDFQTRAYSRYTAPSSSLKI